MNHPNIIYEVYDKRVLAQGPAGLVVLDRETQLDRAKKSANRWGGVVLKCTIRIITRRPFAREILSYEVKFVHQRRYPTGSTVELSDLRRNYRQYWQPKRGTRAAG